MVTYRCLRTLDAKSQAPVVVLRFLSKRVAASGTTRGGLELWDLESGTCRQDLVGHHGRIRAVFVVESGTTLVSLDEQRHLRVWDLQETRCRVHLDCSDHEGIFGLLAVTDDGTRAFSVSDAGHGCLWDLAAGAIERHLELALGQIPVRAEFALQDPQTVYLELEDRSWRTLDLPTGACSHEPPPTEVRLGNGHPDYRVVVVDERVVLRRRDDDRELLVLEGHDEPVLCAAIAPDAGVVLSGDAGGRIRLWTLDWS
jgi:WD40 repeat protein